MTILYLLLDTRQQLTKLGFARSTVNHTQCSNFLTGGNSTTKMALLWGSKILLKPLNKITFWKQRLFIYKPPPFHKCLFEAVEAELDEVHGNLALPALKTIHLLINEFERGRNFGWWLHTWVRATVRAMDKGWSVCAKNGQNGFVSWKGVGHCFLRCPSSYSN